MRPSGSSDPPLVHFFWRMIMFLESKPANRSNKISINLSHVTSYGIHNNQFLVIMINQEEYYLDEENTKLFMEYIHRFGGK